jgi:hypothetical protein
VRWLSCNKLQRLLSAQEYFHLPLWTHPG